MTTSVDVKLSVPFNLEDAQRAGDDWGLNCGPAAVAAVCGLTLEQVRPLLGDFEKKRYTNPALMWQILRATGRHWKKNTLQQCSSEHQGSLAFPQYGLARVQWEGPWTAPGVPMRVRYRHTHWVGGALIDPRDWTTPGWEEPRIFDVNCMCVGGWVPFSEWSESVVPWLLKECEPKANGRWHLTHVVEIERPR